MWALPVRCFSFKPSQCDPVTSPLESLFRSWAAQLRRLILMQRPPQSLTWRTLKLLFRAVAKSLGDCSILSQVVAPNLLLTNSPWKMLAGFSVEAPPSLIESCCRRMLRNLWRSPVLIALTDVALHWSSLLSWLTSQGLALRISLHWSCLFCSQRMFIWMFNKHLIGNCSSTAVVTFNLRLLTQENVLVGGFFVISGYVSAYTTTKLGALGVEASLLNMWHIGKSIRFWLFIQGYSVPISYMAPCWNPKVLKQTNQ